MSTPLGYNELLQCPYEKAHRIQAHAMSKHLFKCRKNHPNQKLVSCPFNESHRVAAPELKLHTQQCEDRASFDTYKYCIASNAVNIPQSAKEPELIYNNSPPREPNDTTRSKKDPKFTTYRDSRTRYEDNEVEEEQQSSSLFDDECWDDMNVPAYNPQKYCEKAPVIRKATLKKPSEKKKFYESERLRLQDLKLTE